MFTGIIEEVGRVSGIKKKGNSCVLKIISETVSAESSIGDSIAVNGICLTVSVKNSKIMTFDVTGETFTRTNLKNIKKGDYVNIERSIRADGRFGGHLVYGHIDCTRPIINLDKNRVNISLDIGINEGDRDFITEKGSITVDGISLTIGRMLHDRMRIYLIPHTVNNTTVFNMKIGDYVNIEFDIVAKYLRKYRKKSKITKDFLRNRGF